MEVLKIKRFKNIYCFNFLRDLNNMLDTERTMISTKDRGEGEKLIYIFFIDIDLKNAKKHTIFKNKYRI